MSKSGDEYIDRISTRIHTKLGIPKDEVERILGGDPLKEEISYLKNHKVPDRIAYGAVSKGIAESITQGKPLKGIKAEDVARGVYETLAADRQYRGVAQAMLEDGIIEKSDVEKIIRRTGESSKAAAKSAHVLEDLLKKAAVILLLVGGVFYMFKTFSGLTGGVIGTLGVTNNVLVMVTLFALALAITHFFIKE